jgi:hypothetical protein
MTPGAAVRAIRGFYQHARDAYEERAKLVAWQTAITTSQMVALWSRSRPWPDRLYRRYMKQLTGKGDRRYGDDSPEMQEVLAISQKRVDEAAKAKAKKKVKAK